MSPKPETKTLRDLLPAFPIDRETDDRDYVDEPYDAREVLLEKGLLDPERPEDLRREHLVWR